MIFSLIVEFELLVEIIDIGIKYFGFYLFFICFINIFIYIMGVLYDIS